MLPCDKTILSLQKVSIGYSQPLVSDIEATLQRGEICLLIGNNGQGKTTLFKSILGQLPVLKGSIFIDNQNLQKITPKRIAKQISVVFSKGNIPVNYTVRDLVSLGKYIHYPYYFKLSKNDEKNIEQIIDRLDLTIYLKTPLVHLSDGNLQKAFIGRALAQNTPVIILDEPTTHLDEDNKKSLLKLLRSLAKDDHKTILFSSHDIYGASEVADTIWAIQDGRLKPGLAEDMLLEHIRSSKPHSTAENLFPTITAPDLEKQLLKNALSKNLTRYLSSYQITFHNHLWLCRLNNKEDQFSSISQLIKFLSQHNR